ncbi:hypothetical protein [Parageobacillus thermantarcticus]|uniref:hypothetical protein n=1 Tax=Parageobacillus thermantarcticus TaxID=186116 RepID=UPI001160E23C|nr:hypothetical protein [Parageobacillus thermantarcticus]
MAGSKIETKTSMSKLYSPSNHEITAHGFVIFTEKLHERALLSTRHENSRSKGAYFHGKERGNIPFLNKDFACFLQTTIAQPHGVFIRFQEVSSLAEMICEWLCW